MKEPVDHILRPQLPWRSCLTSITECGYNAASVKSLTREAFAARLKGYGEQRTALVTCMTCMHTAQRWPTWEQDARLALQREIEWEAVHWNARVKQVIQYSKERGHSLLDELRAIEALIAAHPQEFRELLAGVDARRQWLARKAQNERSQ